MIYKTCSSVSSSSGLDLVFSVSWHEAKEVFDNRYELVTFSVEFEIEKSFFFFF